MNKAYRVIWNAVTSTWSVVSEIATAHRKGGTRALVAASAVFSAGAAMAIDSPGSLNGHAGIYINDVSNDGGCIAAYDAASGNGGGDGKGWLGINSSNYSGQQQYCNATDKATQTNRVLFYGATAAPNAQNGSPGTDSLTLGGELYVNSGKLVLSNQWTKSLSLAIGDDATLAKGAEAIAIGNGASAAGDTSVAVGKNSVAKGTRSMAFGLGASANGTEALAVGISATTGKSNAVAVGSYANAAEDHSLAMGTSAQATANSAVAIGRGATAAHADSIALGKDSTTTVGAQTNYAAYNVGTSTSKGELNIGNRTITGVAPGIANTDAVNVAQLKVTDGKVATLATQITNIDGRVSAVEGDITRIDTTLADAVMYDDATHTSISLGDGTTMVSIHNVADGVDAHDAVNVGQLTDATSTLSTTLFGNVENHFGQTLRYFKANGAEDGSDDAQATGTHAVAMGPGAVASMDNSVALGAFSVTARGAQVGYTAYALSTAQTSAGEVSIGNRQITGVAAGSASDDAVNVAQLAAVDAKISGTGGLDERAVKYDLNPDGSVNTGKVTLGGTTSTDGGLTGGTTITNVAQGELSATSTDAVNGAQLYATNQLVTHIENRVSNVEGDISDIRNELGNSLVKQDGATRAITVGGATDGSVINVSGTQGDRTMTGVRAGVADNDAVNVSQLRGVQDQVTNIYNNGTKYVRVSSTQAGAQATGNESVAIGGNAQATADNSVALGSNSVADRADSVSVGAQGAERQITNVAAGTADTDAANVGQVKAAVANVNQQFGDLNGKIDDLDKSTRRGIAAAAALQIVTPYLPGRTTVNAGVAAYRGQSAIGVGVSRWNTKGTINFNAGVSTATGGNDTIIRAGVAFVLGD